MHFGEEEYVKFRGEMLFYRLEIRKKAAYVVEINVVKVGGWEPEVEIDRGEISFSPTPHIEFCVFWENSVNVVWE